MSRLGPLYLALAIFPLLALIGALPYVALQFRRRGTAGAGHLALAAIFGLYLVGLAFFVILPLYPVTADFCSIHGVAAHLNPSYLLDELRADRALGGWRAVLGGPEVQATVLNVFLFIPLGMFVRHLLGRGLVATVAIGFTVSLFIELTQLTGNWGLYPCAYRFFDTLDLVTNTTGAAIGAVCAPLLRLVPAQYALADPGARQPVTPQRRALAAICNAAALLVIGLLLLGLVGAALELTRGQLLQADSARAGLVRAATLIWIPGALLLLAAPLAFGGRTPGEWAVLLIPSGPGGEAPDTPAIIARFVVGPAPLLALAGLALAGLDLAWLAFAVVAALHGVQLMRSATGAEQVELRSGIRLIDSR